MPPLIGTTGAASARGFGLFAASLGAPAYLGLTTSPNNNNINALTTDSQNNTIMVNPNPGTGAPVMKVSPAGTIVWSKVISTSGNTLFRGLACDSSDNIYVVGEVSGGVGGLIIKLDSSGNILWQRQQNAGSSSFGTRRMWWESVKVMPNGNVAIGGTYEDKYRVDTCCGPVTVSPLSSSIAVYSSSGTLQWSRRYGTTNVNTWPNAEWTNTDVGVDSSNNVYVTARCTDMYVSGTSGSTRGALPVLKYNSSGTFQWGYGYMDSSSTNTRWGVLAVGANAVYVAACEQNASAFIKVDLSGTLQWARDVQNGGNNIWSSFRGCALDPDENFYMTGQMQYTGTTQQFDYGTVKVDSSGTVQWLRSVGRQSSSGQQELARSIGITADNHYCIGGFGEASTQELFTRLKNDGSQTGTYTISGTQYTYQAIGQITFPTTTISVNSSANTAIHPSGTATLTYTETTPSFTSADFGATISTRTL